MNSMDIHGIHGYPWLSMKHHAEATITCDATRWNHMTTPLGAITCYAPPRDHLRPLHKVSTPLLRPDNPQFWNKRCLAGHTRFLSEWVFSKINGIPSAGDWIKNRSNAKMKLQIMMPWMISTHWNPPDPCFSAFVREIKENGACGENNHKNTLLR